MPVSVVVGGQFGSEGKGKVAKHFAESQNATVAVRCGGPNSGHTVISNDNAPIIFKHLPTASILPDIISVLGAGSYIDLEILFAEIQIAGIKDNLLIDPNAVIITDSHYENEKNDSLIKDIASTGSGTGAAVVDRIKRKTSTVFAKDIDLLKPFVKDVKTFLRERLKRKERIIIEGTQGYGLSLLHSDFYPYVTSRDTTAAGFISEVGVSPLDVDDVILTIRAFPIRVAGTSGPLHNEICWDTITNESGSEQKLCEFTSVTKRIRRVARFDADIVKKAIITNAPTKIVLNHLDYIDSRVHCFKNSNDRITAFISMVEKSIDERVSHVGFSPKNIEVV